MLIRLRESCLAGLMIYYSCVTLRIVSILTLFGMPKTVNRTNQFPVRLTDELYSDLQKFSKKYGQSVSVMGAIAVAEWIQRQQAAEDQPKLTSEQVAERMLNQPDKMMEMLKAFKASGLAVHIDKMKESLQKESVIKESMDKDSEGKELMLKELMGKV